MKKAWMGSTLMYIPFRLLIEASQMRRYHNKLKVEGAGNTYIRQSELVEEGIVVLAVIKDANVQSWFGAGSSDF